MVGGAGRAGWVKLPQVDLRAGGVMVRPARLLFLLLPLLAFGQTAEELERTLPMKDPVVAMRLSWAWPGLGTAYVDRAQSIYRPDYSTYIGSVLQVGFLLFTVNQKRPVPVLLGLAAMGANGYLSGKWAREDAHTYDFLRRATIYQQRLKEINEELQRLLERGDALPRP